MIFKDYYHCLYNSNFVGIHMVKLETPVCEFGKPAIDFSLAGVDGKTWTLADCRGEKGLLVMFICNHCPYVKAIQERLVRDCHELIASGVGCVGISSNDPEEYPEDRFELMQQVARDCKYPFPYLWDETQEVAKAYGAVCTPDFFGYNKNLQLQYRGRLDAGGRDPSPLSGPRELCEAMVQVARTGHGPKEQISSIGCSIKWRAG